MSRRADLATLAWMSVLAATLLWELTAAVSGRAEFVDRYGAGGKVRIVMTLALLGVLLAVSVVGFVRSREEDPLRRLRGLAMGGGVLLLGVHAALTWLPTLGGSSPMVVHQGLLDALPTPGSAVAYALGVASLAVGFEPAIRRAARALGVRRESTLRWVGLAAMVGPALFFVLIVNALGVFMIGRPAFFGGEAPAAPVLDSEAPPDPEATP